MFHGNKASVVLRIFAGAALLVSALWGQTAGTGTLVGTISDSTGAIIGGAKVIVVNSETAFTSETTASAEGAYYVPYLSPGVYRLTIETSGFKKYVRDGIQIRIGEIP